MALKDLLVLVDSTKAATRRIQYAAELAAVHDAHLTGLYVKSPPEIPAYVMAEMPSDVRQIQQKLLSDQAHAAEAKFLDAVRAVGRESRSEWRVARGDAEMAAEILVRYADLVIAGQLDPDEGRHPETVDPGDLLLGTGRPVLLVPYALGDLSVGKRIMVAWNGSRESARAVADAMPILEAARHVTIMAVNPGPELGDEPCGDIALHLARHGVDAEAAHLQTDELSPGDAILSRASDIGADMLVMGAYGRSRLRELVLGGVTRHMLNHMTVPVFMTH